MTHTLHRRGSNEQLTNDFIILVDPAKGYNREGCGPLRRKVLQTLLEHNPINYGNHADGMALTVPKEQLLENMASRHWGPVQAVFTNEDDLVAALKDLVEKDYGLSVVVSGLFDHVHACCRQVGLKPHTVNTSLGMFGRTDKLPDEKTLELATMCGHGMISFNSIKKAAADIKAGTITAHEAARKLGAYCHCGIVNFDVAESILLALASR